MENRIKKFYGVRVFDKINLDTILTIIKIVPETDNIDWYLESIEASGNLQELNINMAELKRLTQQGNIGKKMTANDLISILSRLESLDSILLLGGEINLELLDFKKDQSVFENTEYVLEFFDSTEWTISSWHVEFIEHVEDVLKADTLNYFHFNCSTK